jgi:hypothetical protein
MQHLDKEVVVKLRKLCGKENLGEACFEATNKNNI